VNRLSARPRAERIANHPKRANEIGCRGHRVGPSKSSSSRCQSAEQTT